MSNVFVSINPKVNSVTQYIKLVWKYRNSIHSLGKQLVKSKYANTFSGTLIILIKLALTLTVYCFVFGSVLKIDSGQTPYIIFVLTGYMAWSLFISCMSECSSSLLSTKHLFTKIYMPKFALPVSRIYPGIYEYAVAFAALVLLMAIFGIPFSIKFFMIPFVLLLNIFVGFSIGIWISILSIKKQDLLHIIPYIVGFSYFITPVFYPSSIIPPDYSFIIYLNPLAFIVDLYRWIFISSEAPNVFYLFGLIPVVVLFLLGFNTYRKKDKTIVDFI